MVVVKSKKVYNLAIEKILQLRSFVYKEKILKNIMKKRNSASFIFIMLGMLTAFGPFVTDMYLPSLPSMTGYFKTSVSMVQLGLTFSMFGMAFGQLLFGHLSDKYGRRKPLLIAMILFLISTFACVFAPNIEIFVVLRLIQGIGAAGGIVIARSVAADKFKGRNLTKAFAVVGAINGMAPVVAPITGGLLVEITGWKGIFAILFVWGIILTSVTSKFKESLSQTRRSKEKLSKTIKMFKNVLKNKEFVFYTLQIFFTMAILFSYISASPFIIQEHYKFSPVAFSLFFAANAAAIGTGAAISSRFKNYEKSLKTGSTGMIICSILLLCILAINGSIVFFEGLLFILCFMMGLTFPVTISFALNSAKKQSGTASAIIGASGFLAGSIVSPIVGLGNILISTGIAFTVSSISAAVFAFLVLKYRNLKI